MSFREHTTEGRMRQGATKLGLSLGEYYRQVEAGNKWCSGHKTWERRERFGRNRARADGLSTICLTWNLQYVLGRQQRLRDRRAAS